MQVKLRIGEGLRKINGSVYLLVEKRDLEHLGVNMDDPKALDSLELIKQDDSGKHGNFISYWKSRPVD